MISWGIDMKIALSLAAVLALMADGMALAQESAEPIGSVLPSNPAAYPAWGVLNDLAGKEWEEPSFDSGISFEWREPGQPMVQKSRTLRGEWMAETLLTLEPSGQIRIATGNRRGVVDVGPDGEFTVVYGGMILPMRLQYTLGLSG